VTTATGDSHRTNVFRTPGKDKVVPGGRYPPVMHCARTHILYLELMHAWAVSMCLEQSVLFLSRSKLMHRKLKKPTNMA
jgi:hypothetical protein